MDPTQINDTFRSFYSDLYKSKTSLDEVKCDNFLARLKLPQLAVEEANDLAKPISLEELKKAKE